MAYNDENRNDQDERIVPSEMSDFAKDQVERQIKNRVTSAATKSASTAAVSGASTGAMAGTAGQAISGSASAAASAGASATAGATASAGGAATGAGAGAGLGAAAGPVGAAAGAIASMAVKKIKEGNQEGEEKSSVGLITGICIIVALLISCFSLLFEPSNLTHNGTQNAIEENEKTSIIEKYKAQEDKLTSTDEMSSADKKAFFDKVFKKYGMTEEDIDTTLNLYGTGNETNYRVMKEIIDHAIYLCLMDKEGGWISNYVSDETIIKGIIDIFIKGYSLQDYLYEKEQKEKTYNSFRNSWYPYSLKRADGYCYTIDDFSKSFDEDGLYDPNNAEGIPECDFNNDLNYAEVISVIALREDMQQDQFTLSSFYDVICDPKMRKFFAEIDKEVILYRIDEYGTEVEFNSLEEAQGWVATHPLIATKTIQIGNYLYTFTYTLKDGLQVSRSKIKGSGSSTSTSTSSSGFISASGMNSIPETYDEDEITEELAEELKKLQIRAYVKVDVLPYGLRELFTLSEIGYLDESVDMRTVDNNKMMEWYEKTTRLTVENTDIDFLGTSYKEKRSPLSKVYSYTQNGRSCYYYTQDTVYDGDGEYTYYGNGTIILDYDIKGAKILPIGYISQKIVSADGKKAPRNGGSTIYSEGCIECSYIMCIQYLTGTYINVESVSQNSAYFSPPSSGTFNSSALLSKYGCGRNLVKPGTPTPKKIKESIDNDHPIVMRISQPCPFYYGSQQHFVVICGYSEEGFYILDPFTESNNLKCLPYNNLQSGIDFYSEIYKS